MNWRVRQDRFPDTASPSLHYQYARRIRLLLGPLDRAKASIQGCEHRHARYYAGARLYSTAWSDLSDLVLYAQQYAVANARSHRTDSVFNDTLLRQTPSISPDLRPCKKATTVLTSLTRSRLVSVSAIMIHENAFAPRSLCEFRSIMQMARWSLYVNDHVECM